MAPDNLFALVDKTLKNLIGASSGLMKRDPFHYIIKGDNSALNRIRNSPNPVKVSKWFNDFWLFFEIKFKINDASMMKINGKEDKHNINTFISLSVFQGTDSDKEKYQLIRAEWDDYNVLDEKHAQPHWHITSGQALENTFKEYADMCNEVELVKEFEKEKQKVLDVKKIHFAINGDWQKDNNHIHKIEDEKQVAKWLQGILFHLRTELENL